MKGRRRYNVIGRACGVVAVVFVVLWVSGQWWGELAAALPNGRLGLRKEGRGALEVVFSSEPALYVYRFDGYDWDSGQREMVSSVRLDANASVIWMLERQRARPAEYFAAQWSTTPKGLSWWPGYSVVPGLTTFTLPFWCLALPFAAVAVATERRHRDMLNRDRTGRCRRCNYDRIGIVADAVCPECGSRP